MINEVMVANGVTTAEIPEHGVDPADLEAIAHSKRYFKTKAFASFDDHGSCPRTWKSAHAWCVLDLKEQLHCSQAFSRLSNLVTKKPCQSLKESP